MKLTTAVFPDHSNDCHCDAERVKRVLEQVPEVVELLRELVEHEPTESTAEHDITTGDYKWACVFCGVARGQKIIEHTDDCLITRARALVERGE